MRLENIKKMKEKDFYRYLGIKRYHFNEMLEKLLETEKQQKSSKGRKNKLTMEERLIITLEYWKEYPTFFQMSLKYNMSASSCFRNINWIENALSEHSDYQSLKNKYQSKIAKNEENLNQWECYLIDATEIEIERPTKKNNN